MSPTILIKNSLVVFLLIILSESCEQSHSESDSVHKLNSPLQNEEFFKGDWTNGHESYSVEKIENNVISFIGVNFHEGGYQFQIYWDNEQNKYRISETENTGIGNPNNFLELITINNEKIILIKSSDEKIERVLLQLNKYKDLSDYTIKNKINHQLSGEYKDVETNRVITFEKNKNIVTGLLNEREYKIGYNQYDTPTDLLMFKTDTLIYEKKHDTLLIYKAYYNDSYGDYERKNENILYKLIKTKHINFSSNSELEGDYSFASDEILTDIVLSFYSKEELRLIRNEIFARYGYLFKANDLIKYFENKNWYNPQFENVSNKLTELEKINIQIISDYENKVDAII